MQSDAPSPRTPRQRVRRLLTAVLRVLRRSFILIVVLELGLRLCGFPTGFFRFLLPADGLGPYPVNAEILSNWGRIPYLVRTNSLGLRGREISAAKPRGIKRLAAVGDSVTDGFFVDNEATFPQLLEDLLIRRFGARYEVLNAARGGGSIDKELALLQETALPLQPDIVLLTFLANDIYNIKGRSRQDLLDYRLEFRAHGPDPAERAALWITTQSALAEAAGKPLWHALLWRRDMPRSIGSGDARYRIAGGYNFIENARLYLEEYRNLDGPVLRPFSAEAQALIQNYLFVLDRFIDLCRAGKAVPVFIYFPVYPEIYLPGQSRELRGRMQDECRARALPFLDLTPALRAGGAQTVIHLAPIDFHLNPAGNLIMAEAVLEFLKDQGLVP
jgi:lysophospholipase L1-like esterase